jgi:hypothetical protein
MRRVLWPRAPAPSCLHPSNTSLPLRLPASLTRNAPKRSAGQQRILDLSAAGDYQTIAKEGVTLLAGDNPDDELRLIFANSLAWTGRLQAAVAAYSVMTNGKYANEATLGMASVNRWMGRDDLALPLYKAVLDRDSSNDAALEGLEMVTRELKPKTSISIGGAADSSNMERKSATVSHRWRDKGGTVIMEVETMGVRDTLPTSPNGAAGCDSALPGCWVGVEAKPRDQPARHHNPYDIWRR